MAYTLPVPSDWRSQEWKVKIFDDERNEEPHVTIIRKTQMWRLGLRTGEFLDDGPPPRDVPKHFVGWIRSRLAELRREWDGMYPENPVSSREE